MDNKYYCDVERGNPIFLGMNGDNPKRYIIDQYGNLVVVNGKKFIN